MEITCVVRGLLSLLQTRFTVTSGGLRVSAARGTSGIHLATLGRIRQQGELEVKSRIYQKDLALSPEGHLIPAWLCSCQRQSGSGDCPSPTLL